MIPTKLKTELEHVKIKMDIHCPFVCREQCSLSRKCGQHAVSRGFRGDDGMTPSLRKDENGSLFCNKKKMKVHGGGWTKNANFSHFDPTLLSQKIFAGKVTFEGMVLNLSSLYVGFLPLQKKYEEGEEGDWLVIDKNMEQLVVKNNGLLRPLFP